MILRRSWRTSWWKCRRSFPGPCCSSLWSKTTISTPCKGNTAGSCCPTTGSGTRRGKDSYSSTVAMWFWVRLSLVVGGQEWSWLVRVFPGLPSYAAAGAAAGSDWAACQSRRLLEEFPLLRCLLVALFALGNLYFAFALVSFSPSGVWVLPVEYVVLDFSGRVRGFLLLSAAGALDDEDFFIIEGSMLISLSDCCSVGHL